MRILFVGGEANNDRHSSTRPTQVLVSFTERGVSSDRSIQNQMKYQLKYNMVWRKEKIPVLPVTVRP